MPKKFKVEAVDPSLPYLLRDPNQIAGGLWLVCSTTFCGVVAVSRRVFMPGVNMAVTKRVIMDWELPRFVPVPWTEETSLQSFLAGIKSEAVAHGADAEAVYLLGELSPFEPKEMNIMANKLKTKGAKPAAKAPKADKPAKAAKEKTGTAVPRVSANASKKIQLLVKPKDSGLRGGRLAKLQAIADNKPKLVSDILGTVVTDDAGKEHKIDSGAISGMVKRGHIALA